MQTKFAPPNSYLGYNTRIRENMLAMDRFATDTERDSFNTMRMLISFKKHSRNRKEYLKARNSFIKKR